MSKKDLLFPVGRLIGGSVHKLKGATMQDGHTPKLGKDGTQQMSIAFGVAFPKTQVAWQNESFQHSKLGLIAWGAEIYKIAQADFPQMMMSPAFAWKITDGDSTIPNKRGKVPNTMAGYPGHWVIWFSQGWQPKLVTADGQAELPAEKFLPGYYVQVFASVAGNGASGTNTPGIYMNPIAVALVGEGEVINVDVDTTAIGFGSAALPVGAIAPTAVAPAFGGVAPAAPIAVAPSAAYMAAPAPAAPRYVMTPKAGAYTKEQYLATPGWTEQMLIEQGYMTLG